MTASRGRSLPRRNPPMWLRWVLSLTVAAAVAVALVRFVETHSTVGLAAQSPQALARQHREADILAAQDQAPHVVAMPPSASQAKLVRSAIAADMADRIQRGLIGGTLQRVGCRPARHREGALGLACVATASDVNYDYAVVVHPRAHRLVWCRHDAPPVPNRPVPLSPRCTA